MNFNQFTLVGEDAKDAMSMISWAENMSLDQWVDKVVVGKNFQTLMNMGSYINLYFGNKYGMGPQHNDPDQAMQDFTNKLTTFFNPLLKPDRSGKRPRPDETPEFADEHNKAEYDEYDKLYRNAWRNAIKKPEEKEEWLAKRDEYAKLRSQTEFQKARSKTSKNTEQHVKDMFMTPISTGEVQDLIKEYPKQWAELQAAYDGMVSQTSDSRSG
jgi:hypothetical protein